MTLRIAVIGCGYVGIVSGACLAAKGHVVRCVDTQSAVVSRINAGRPHIYERGLEDLLSTVTSEGRLSATTDFDAALEQADGVIIAVGTPTEQGKISLQQVVECAKRIGSFLRVTNKFLPVVVKSTVLPGVTDTIVREALEASSGKQFGQFGLGMNPEFLREGDAIADFMNPDRIVLGFEDTETRNFLDHLYSPWNCDKIRVNTRTAELIKYANNALLATQISAVNEIANLASAIGGIDVLEVVRGVHLDKRWNPIVEGKRVEPGILTYLVPGCGFGGSCFPKDIQALRTHGAANGVSMRLLESVLAINEDQPQQVFNVLSQAVRDISKEKILVLGLAFKPETDDVREAPSIKIVRGLLQSGAMVSVHDPKASENFQLALGEDSARIRFVADWRKCIAENTIIVVTTAWPEYRDLSNAQLAGKVVFDARRLFALEELRGARYLAIGKR